MELKIHDREIVLQRLWKAGKLHAGSLQTLSGKPVEILYAGSENFDAGPDFKEAVLRIAGVLLRGDIEVHLNASGWTAHGHHKDAGYNRVILHLISDSAGSATVIEREDGVKIEQALVDLDPSTIKMWKNSNPLSNDSGRPPTVVADCPLSIQPADRIRTVIKTGAEQRLKDKASQLQEELQRHSWDQVIYKNILEALGYSKNREPFRRLADRVPFDLVRQEMQWVSKPVAEFRCTALLFGAAGLLPTRPSGDKDNEVTQYLAPLVELWSQTQHRHGIRPLPTHEWRFFRLRPQNFPTRRLAGMAALMMKFHENGILDLFVRLVEGHCDHLRRLRLELEGIFIQRADKFWRRHYQFEAHRSGASPSVPEFLIGRDRAREIVVNIVVPTLWLYACDSQDGKLKNVVLELYRSYPKLPENGITRVMRLQLFGSGPKKNETVTTAWTQQGMIQLHKLYCRGLKCSECLSKAEA